MYINFVISDVLIQCIQLSYRMGAFHVPINFERFSSAVKLQAALKTDNDGTVNLAMKEMTRKSKSKGRRVEVTRSQVAHATLHQDRDTRPLPSRQLPMNFHSYHESRSLRIDHLAQKTFTTSRSLTYTYYRSTKPASTKPTLLLPHG
jgi:2'-5' RNA ligase